MRKSNLFRVNPDKKILEKVKKINLSDSDLEKRFEIQEWIESTPKILGEELLIIAKEQSLLEGTSERADLVALDKEGNVVVIEIERDDAEDNILERAIKYASYYAQFDTNSIVTVFTDYLYRRDNTSESDENHSTQRIIEFVTDGTLDGINTNQRFILVSHKFPREVITAVNWLIERYRMNIKCIQIIPYYDSDKKTYYLQSNEILSCKDFEEDLLISTIPASEYPASDESETGIHSTNGSVKKSDEVTRFFESIRDNLSQKLDRELMPNRHSRLARDGRDFRGYHFWFNSGNWDNHGNSYKIWLFNEDCKEKDLAGKFGIYLEISRKHLLTHGVTRENIEKLIINLKNLNIDDFEFSDYGDNFSLDGFMTNNRLSEETKNEIVDKLVRLIQETKSTVSDLTR